MKNIKAENRLISNLKRALLAAICLAVVFGGPSMAHASYYWWWWRW